MKQNSWKLLADANISVKTVDFLLSQGIDIIRVHPSFLTDEEVIELARKESRAILTFDKDFGEIYYFSKNKSLTIIVLYVVDQRIEAVNPIIKLFLENHSFEEMNNKLILLYEGRYRILD